MKCRSEIIEMLIISLIAMAGITYIITSWFNFFIEVENIRADHLEKVRSYFSMSSDTNKDEDGLDATILIRMKDSEKEKFQRYCDKLDPPLSPAEALLSYIRTVTD